MFEIDSESSDASRVLLVEGQSDAYVVRHLAQRHGKLPDFRIVNKRRLSNVLSGVSGELKREALETLGILVDADDDVQARWEELQSHLPVEIQSPASPQPGGTIIESEKRIGIWLMPDNSSKGEIESFVREMIPSQDVIWPRSRRYINEIPLEERPFRNDKVLKAMVYAWFATRSRPGLMGEAIRTGELELQVPMVQDFLAWLERLYE